MQANTDITLARDPTAVLQATTKQYVDAADALKAPLASPVFTGDARAVTPTAGDNDTSIATTAFVQTALASVPTSSAAHNLLHNAQFNIAQRGVGPFNTAGVYTLDRWLVNFSLDTASVQQTAVNDAQRASIGDEAATNCFNTNVTGNAGASAFTNCTQPMEDVRRLAGKTVTVSFYAWCGSGALKLGVSFDQLFGTGGSPSTAVIGNGQSVTLSTTPTRYSLTFAVPSISGKTVGTAANSSYTQMSFWFSSSTTQATRAGNIGVQTGGFGIWGVQCEIGSTASPLEKLDPQQDLAMCQRYYQTTSVIETGYQVAGQSISWSLPIPQMRIAPAITQTSNSDGNLGTPGASTFGPNLMYVNGVATVTGTCTINRHYTMSADL
ncbi:MAG TPA: hypothetical protein VGN34_17325 [Ktedonobacteraceae bacterium]